MKKRLRKNPVSQGEPDIFNELDVKAITNNIKITDGGQRPFTTDQIIPYGDDNLYPNKVFDTVRLSPTDKGCVALRTEFIFGKGIEGGDDLIVNRNCETLNEVYHKACHTFAWLDSHVEHFNFNVLGEISEITNIDTRLVRKTEDLLKARLDNYGAFLGSIFTGNKIEIFLYDPENLGQQIEKDGGFDKFKGNIYYWTFNNDIYTISPADASLPSAQLEHKIQMYNFASINNSFSSSGVLKVPPMPNNAEDSNDVDKQIFRMKGAENAGSFLKITIPRDMDGKMQNQNLFEPFQQNNVDKMYVNQSENAKNNIFREFRIPEVLLGVSPDGMFNISAFNDAFNYYNALTEKDRMLMQDSFNKFWSNTVFAAELSEIKVIPLEMKSIDTQTQRGLDDGSDINND